MEWSGRQKARREAELRGWSVFERAISLPMLRKGFDRVARNNGAPGGDGVSVDAFGYKLDFRLKALARKLANGSYEPGPVARHEIPKKGSGVRVLHVPSVADRVAQTAAHLTLQPILEPHFEEHSYGYRPGRSVGRAVEAVQSFHEAGYRSVVDADILAYFDNVPHLPLLSTLSDYVPERAFLALVRQWVELSPHPEKGLPQGAPISPILANLYLDGVDEKIAAAGFRIVRYGDDFVILCRNRKRAEAALALVARLLSRLGLELNPEKTAIRSHDEGYLFLGTAFQPTGLALQVEALADIPGEAEVPRPRAERSVLKGQLGVPPNRRVAGREITPKTPAFARSAEEADAPWTAEDREAYLSEGDEPPEPEIVEADGRHAPFIRPLYITEKGRELRTHQAGFGVYENGHPIAVFGPDSIDRIDIFPRASISNDAIRRAGDLRIPVFFVDGWGRLQSSLADERPWRSRLHLAQAEHSIDEGLATKLARQFVAGRIHNARRLIQQLRLRLDKTERAARADLTDVITVLGRHLRNAESNSGLASVAQVRGEEGAAMRRYWPALSSLVRRGFSDARFRRSRMPPETPFNTVLNFTAYLLRRDVETLLMRRGIHAGFGVLHRPHKARHGCVFDLMEEFRAPTAEAVSVTLFSTGMLSEADFAEQDIDGQRGIRLVDEGPRKVIRAYEQHMDHEVRRPIGGMTTWRGVMEDQISGYIRHVLGEAQYEYYRKDL